MGNFKGIFGPGLNIIIINITINFKVVTKV